MIPKNCSPLSKPPSAPVYRWSPAPADQYGARGKKGPDNRCWQSELATPAWNLVWLLFKNPNAVDCPVRQVIDLTASLDVTGTAPWGKRVQLGQLAFLPASWANSLITSFAWERVPHLELWEDIGARTERCGQARSEHPDLYAIEEHWAIPDVSAARTVLRSLGFKNFADV